MAGIAINTCSSHYPSYQKIEEKFKTNMYKIAPDPLANRHRINLAWQEMDYEEHSLGNELAELILQYGVDILVEEKTLQYQQLIKQVEWLKRPEDPVKLGTQYFPKTDLKYGLGHFLTQQIVKAIPLPSKI